MIILLVCEGATAPVASEPSGVRIVKFPGFVELPGPSQGSAVRRDCGKCFDELDIGFFPLDHRKLKPLSPQELDCFDA
jgi:hypothetical protein